MATRPTMMDVARLAGVSKTTVSYVLTGSGYFSEERRARIELAIARLGYRPNAFARGLSAHRVSTVGVISADPSDAFVARVTSGIIAEASVHDILVMVSAHDPSARAGGSGRRAQRQPSDAVIYIAGHDYSRDAYVALAEDHLVVLAGEADSGVGVAAVVVDPRPAARELASLVAAGGHERIAIAASKCQRWSMAERMVGLSEGLAAAGIPPQRITTVWVDVSVQGGRMAADQLFADESHRSDRPTAVLCVDDDVAIGVIQRCGQRGLSVPDQVSVTGFGDTSAASRVVPTLTTARIPAEKVGHAALQMLIQRGEMSPSTISVWTIAASVMPGGSVRGSM